MPRSPAPRAFYWWFPCAWNGLPAPEPSAAPPGSVEKQLVNAGNVLNAQYSLQLHNATLLNEVTRGLSTVSEQLHELSTLQTNANAPIADNLARISSILVLLVRLIGVLIGVIGLVMLCRSLWKLGEAFDAPKAHSVGA